MKRGKKINAGYCKLSCADEPTFKVLLSKKITYSDRRLEIRPHLSDQALAQFRKEFNLRRVYIYNINPFFSDAEIEMAFSQTIGSVESAYCIRKKVVSKRKNNIPMFGYVLFKSKSVAEKAIELGEITHRDCKIRI